MAEKRCKRFNLSSYICADKDDLPFWTNILQSSDTKNTHVRVNIDTEEEFLSFRKAVEAAAKVRFIVERSRPTEKFLWTKVFGCHHGTHKMDPRTKNPRTITVVITSALLSLCYRCTIYINLYSEVLFS